MKKRHIWIPIVVAVVLFYGICLTGYTLLSRRLKRIEPQGFIEKSYQFVSADKSFSDEYGAIQSFETNQKKPVKIGDHAYYMDFECSTEQSSELLVRVYQKYDNGWTYSYTIIE